MAGDGMKNNFCNGSRVAGNGEICGIGILPMGPGRHGQDAHATLFIRGG
jgi:hypothetical protein